MTNKPELLHSVLRRIIIIYDLHLHMKYEIQFIHNSQITETDSTNADKYCFKSAYTEQVVHTIVLGKRFPLSEYGRYFFTSV